MDVKSYNLVDGEMVEAVGGEWIRSADMLAFANQVCAVIAQQLRAVISYLSSLTGSEY